MGITSDEYWMAQALRQARTSESVDEVPIGAILVAGDEIIGAGYNQPISACDPSAHAEIIALRAAATQQQNYRLPDSTLYVTLEPCIMCAGALIQARITRLVYGAKNPRAGAIESVFNVFHAKQLNHHVKCEGGVREAECVGLLQTFFKKRR